MIVYQKKNDMFNVCENEFQNPQICHQRVRFSPERSTLGLANILLLPTKKIAKTNALLLKSRLAT
jgi:hypothetical protein